MPDWTCLRCGSDARIPDVRLIDRDQSSSKNARVGLATKPDAMLFKAEVVVSTRATVCGECGFVELTADDPHALWSAHVERKGREWDRAG